MNDIDKDIERARIGKKRESLHEVILHKKKAETNLPPLPLKPKEKTPRESKSKSVFDDGQCSMRVSINGNVTRCNKNPTTICPECGKRVCSDHENFHNCTKGRFKQL